MAGWNLGDLFEGVEAGLPADAPALIHGTEQISWGDLASRTRSLAAALQARGAAPDDKVALYLRNGTAYTETLGACFKARLVHVNVNYRYVDDELHYILDDSDAAFVVFDEEFQDRVLRIASRLPRVKGWIQVSGAEGGAVPEIAESYAALVAERPDAELAVERSPDDLMFIYTGGTTGMPKAVMWRHEDIWGALGGGANTPASRGRRPSTPAEHIANVTAHGPGPRQLCACPLMHGTGLLTAIGNLLGGGATLTLSGTRFDPAALFDEAERHRAQSLVIVGDAFARPMLEVLDAEPDRWDLSSLKVVLSSGVMWSGEVKEGLLRHLPGAALADLFGSSEAVGFGTSVTRHKHRVEGATGTFRVGAHCKVFSEDHREVMPGSGERGFIARCGSIPLGYYKDPEKTAKTFPVIDGVRYSIPGDWCKVEADGTLTLLGRGSATINTAGEKVHSEEVEEALKLHPNVADALVVGIPDPKWGQAVTAVVELRRGEFDEDELRAHVRVHLAGYKTPKRVFAVADAMFRGANGKADYRRAAAFVVEQLAGE
ncbi:MAG: acyl-CoA synthetase [Myxococcota bacterium]|nr:acyl-CoA synthetase [Myxococcota bacterium]